MQSKLHPPAGARVKTPGTQTLATTLPTEVVLPKGNKKGNKRTVPTNAEVPREEDLARTESEAEEAVLPSRTATRSKTEAAGRATRSHDVHAPMPTTQMQAKKPKLNNRKKDISEELSEEDQEEVSAAPPEEEPPTPEDPEEEAPLAAKEDAPTPPTEETDTETEDGPKVLETALQRKKRKAKANARAKLVAAEAILAAEKERLAKKKVLAEQRAIAESHLKMTIKEHARVKRSKKAVKREQSDESKSETETSMTTTTTTTVPTVQDPSTGFPMMGLQQMMMQFAGALSSGSARPNVNEGPVYAPSYPKIRSFSDAVECLTLYENYVSAIPRDYPRPQFVFLKVDPTVTAQCLAARGRALSCDDGEALREVIKALRPREPMQVQQVMKQIQLTFGRDPAARPAELTSHMMRWLTYAAQLRYPTKGARKLFALSCDQPLRKYLLASLECPVEERGSEDSASPEEESASTEESTTTSDEDPDSPGPADPATTEDEGSSNTSEKEEEEEQDSSEEQQPARHRHHEKHHHHAHRAHRCKMSSTLKVLIGKDPYKVKTLYLKGMRWLKSMASMMSTAGLVQAHQGRTEDPQHYHGHSASAVTSSNGGGPSQPSHSTFRGSHARRHPRERRGFGHPDRRPEGRPEQSQPTMAREAAPPGGGPTQGMRHPGPSGSSSATTSARLESLTKAPFKKLSPEEHDLLRREGRCFRCRQTGHVSSACPTRPNQPTGRRGERKS
jgi:hypothetical protein